MTVIVVAIDESKDSLIKRRAVFLRLDVNLVIFYRSPKSFYPDVVLCPAPAVHTDLHFRMLGTRFLPIQAGELTTNTYECEFGNLKLIRKAMKGVSVDLTYQSLSSAKKTIEIICQVQHNSVTLCYGELCTFE